MSVLNPYSLALIMNEGSFSCVKAANSLGFVSHNQLTRQLGKEWGFTPITDWETLPKEGRAVLDDSIQAAQQEYLKLYRCPNCRPDLTQLVTA